MLAMAALLWRRLPAQAPAPQQLSYPRLIGSMFTLLRDDRVLRVRGMIALLMFAAFSILWSALVLPLGAPPYNYTHAAIGAFGLVGLAGTLAAARAGHWADRGWAQRVSGGALLMLLLSWLPLAWGLTSLAALVVGILLLDLAVQALQVTNQSLIFRGHAGSHSRLVGCYMMFYAIGSGGGAIAATSMYDMAGWRGVCWLGAAVSLAALLFWALTLEKRPSPE
jgi:predicted MFS family arabinose efflux permease